MSDSVVPDSLYAPSDPVTILNDESFFFHDSKGKIRNAYMQGPGIIKAYASWCPHCISKVDEINRLAGLFADNDLTIYTINADSAVNPHFNIALDIQSYPTFLYVSDDGVVVSGDTLEVRDVPTDLKKAVCQPRKGQESLADQNSALCQ